jgi:hypothetical protein
VFCPRCRSEYVPGYTRCSDCGVALVDSLPEPEHRQKHHDTPDLPSDPAPFVLSTEPLNLVTVLSSGDSGLMAVAKSILASAQIRCLVEGEGVQDLFGIGRVVGGFNPITGPMRLRVRADDAADARLLLADLERSH